MANYIIEPENLVLSRNGVKVVFIESHCPSVTARAHIHSSIEFLYFTRGEFDVTINEEHFLLREGDLVLFPKYAIHSAFARQNGGGAYYVFQVHPEIIKDIAEKEKEAYFQLFFSQNSNVKRFIWRKEELEGSEIRFPIRDLIQEYSSDDYFAFSSRKLNIFRLLLAIIRDPQRENAEVLERLNTCSKTASYVYKACDYINAHYPDDIDAKELADSMNISYKYFLDCFSQTMGEGFKAYLNKTRIKHAKIKLMHSSATISEIGTAVGYNSTSYFILEFRRQTGITPLQFSKKYHNK